MRATARATTRPASRPSTRTSRSRRTARATSRCSTGSTRTTTTGTTSTRATGSSSRSCSVRPRSTRHWPRGRRASGTPSTPVARSPTGRRTSWSATGPTRSSTRPSARTRATCSRPCSSAEVPRRASAATTPRLRRPGCTRGRCCSPTSRPGLTIRSPGWRSTVGGASGRRRRTTGRLARCPSPGGRRPWTGRRGCGTPRSSYRAGVPRRRRSSRPSARSSARARSCSSTSWPIRRRCCSSWRCLRLCCGSCCDAPRGGASHHCPSSRDGGLARSRGRR